MVLSLLGPLVCLLILMVLSPEHHYAPGTTEPISRGLQTLSELLAWRRSSASPLDVASVPLAGRDPPLATSARRTMVSHDMMGGYLDDRWDLALLIQGFVKTVHKFTLPLD